MIFTGIRCVPAKPLIFSLLFSVNAFAAFTEETVFFDLPEALEPDPIPSPTAELANLEGYPQDENQLSLVARVYVPDAAVHGEGPYPTVIVLHGSGGLWSYDVMANGLAFQFRDWGEVLADLGYLAIFPDSYNPRGIGGNFSNRRPHYDPTIDDHLCSPNYERPKDVIATLAYLTTRVDVDAQNIALMGFSHGAQTGINAVLDVSVDLGQYSVYYIDLDDKGNEDPADDEEFSTTKNVDSPVRIGAGLPFPKVCAFYYGGGSHYGYHGSANDVDAGRYMFDRRTKVLMFHGSSDFLMGVDDPLVRPLTGTLYPIKQALASSAQAAAEWVADPLKHHFIFDGVNHGFDRESVAAEQDWDTVAENADQKAKRLARVEVLKYLETYLKPAAELTLELDTPEIGDVQLQTTNTNTRTHYQRVWSADLSTWHEIGASFDGTGTSVQWIDAQGLNCFYRMNYEPIEPPFGDPDNSGFFLGYEDFTL